MHTVQTVLDAFAQLYGYWVTKHRYFRMLAIAIAYGRLEPRNLARKRTDISYWRRAKWRSLFECEAVEYESRTDHTGDQRIALAWHCALPDASRYDRMSRYGYVGLIGGDAGTQGDYGSLGFVGFRSLVAAAELQFDRCRAMPQPDLIRIDLMPGAGISLGQQEVNQ